MPTVSVVMCAYNAAPYLQSSLASVVAQTRTPDEVVLVDDGSTDDTAAIAEGWSDRLPIKVIRRVDNGGVGAARHAAIESSSGDWIVMLDADDYWLPDHLKVLCDTYERNGGLVTAANLRWLPGQRVGERPSTELVPVPAPERQATAILLDNFVFSGSIFSRELYERAGGFRPLRTCEDWDLWVRMVRAGACVTPAPSATVLYRVHPAGLSSGDGLTRGTVPLLEQFVEMTTGREQRHVKRALRRQRARVLMLDGYEHIRAGRTGDGRRYMVRAALLDRSVRRRASHWGGSVTLRALACFVAPRRGVAVRDARQGDPDLVVGGGPHRPWLGGLPRSKASSRWPTPARR